jgi:hypothetical protein
MKDEAELNSTIARSLQIGHKIADPTGTFAVTARAFDGFGSWDGKALYWEAKHLKGLQSFNLKLLRDHQIANLLEFRRKVIDCHTWIILGVSVKRGDNRLYIFSDMEDINRRRDEGRNFLKKEIETLPYLPISKGLVDLTKILLITRRTGETQ